jgi:hypothetical protein
VTVVRANYAITFDPNGKAGTAYTQAIATGVTATLSRMAFTTSDYYFVGWSTDPNATTAEYADGASYTMGESNVTLYAVWIASTANFTYSIADGAVTITNYTDSTMTTLVIPNYIDGYPVTAIGDSAFVKCTLLVSAYIPRFGDRYGCRRVHGLYLARLGNDTRVVNVNRDVRFLRLYLARLGDDPLVGDVHRDIRF